MDMSVDHALLRLRHYVYLDSLDSARFRFDRNPNNESLLHAMGEILLGILMGDAIVVPDNQLVDSAGFIRTAALLVSAASKIGRLDLVPMRLAWYAAPTAFEIATKKLEQIESKDDPKRFMLSSWPYLDNDPKRRKQWAANLRRGIPITKEHTESEAELALAQSLFQVLHFFDEAGPQAKVKADSVKEVRQAGLSRIADLSGRTQESIFSVFENQEAEVCLDTITVLRNLRTQGVPYDDRSQIVIKLATDQAYDKIKADRKMAEEAVLTAVDSIYNFSLGRATKAHLISHTQALPPSAPQISSVYSLAEWSRNTRRIQAGFTVGVMVMPEGFIAPSSFSLAAALTQSQVDQLISRISWPALLEAMADPAWRASLLDYRTALANYEEANMALAERDREDIPSALKGRVNAAHDAYVCQRRRHLAESEQRLSNSYMRIREDELSEAEAKLDINIRLEYSATSEREEGHAKEIMASTAPDASIKAGRYETKTEAIGEITEVQGKAREVVSFRKIKRLRETLSRERDVITGILAQFRSGFCESDDEARL